jgi:hypothetical protein
MTMSPPKPITIDELQGDRSFKEWDIWLQSRLADLGSTRDGLTHMRFDKGPMKVVKEEIIPTLKLLQRRFKGEEIFATFPANNSAADAFIRPASAAVATPLQITCNVDHDDHLRQQILHRDGMVPGAGPITRVGGRLEAQGRAYFIEEMADKLAISIIDRLDSKAQKFSNYDPSTWLLVYIHDDHLPMDGLPILLTKIRNAAAKSPFVATFLVGSTKQEICELIGGTEKWVS